MRSASQTQVFMRLLRLPSRIAVALIRAYQATLSPDHGPLRDLYPHGYCRHEPTCSMYAVESIESRGLVRGGIRAFLRVLSCNPCTPLSGKKILKLSGMSSPEKQK